MREFLIVLFAVSGQLSVIFNVGSVDLTLLIGCVFGLELVATLLLSKIQIDNGRVQILWALAALTAWILIASLYGRSSAYVWTKWLSFGAVLIGFAYGLTKGRQISFLRIAYWHCLYCMVLAVLYYQELITAGNLQSILWNSETLGLSDYLTSSDYFYLSFLMLYSERRWKLLILALLGFVPVLAFLGARGAALFFVVVLVLAFFRDKLRRRYFWVGLAVLIASLSSTTDSMIKYRFESALSGEDNSLNQRQVYFTDACESILRQPLFGVGFGSFGASIYREDKRMYPHNLFLEVLVELGLAGLGFLTYFLIVGWRTFAESKFRWLLLFLLLLLMKSYTFVDLKYLWIFIGMAIAGDSKILGDSKKDTRCRTFWKLAKSV